MGQVDADGGACNGDMTVTSTVQLATNLDLCPWNLSNLIDFGALSANDGSNQLHQEE